MLWSSVTCLRQCLRKKSYVGLVRSVFLLCGCFGILRWTSKMAMSCKDGKGGPDNGKYVRYTPEQVEALERLYHECPKPSSIRRQQLIRECPILSNIEPKQIKVWFQNRRYGINRFRSQILFYFFVRSTFSWLMIKKCGKNDIFLLDLQVLIFCFLFFGMIYSIKNSI